MAFNCGFAYKHLHMDSIAQEFRRLFADFVGRHIDEAAVASFKKNCMLAVSALPNHELLPPRRIITVTYRGVLVNLHVTSLGNELEIRLATALKSMAVELGGLQ